MAAIMGMNLSNAFQSTRIPLEVGAEQIAKLPAGLVKVFSPEGLSSNFWNSVSNNGLEVALGTTNDTIISFANDLGTARTFVGTIKQYAKAILWVCVGNEPLGSWYNNQYNPYLGKAVGNLCTALQEQSLNIGVTVPQNFEFMQASYPPSAGSIKEEYQQTIKDTCDVMNKTGAPFMVNIYPFITRTQNRNDVPLDYCLFTAGSDHWVYDGSYTYKNIFDAMIDALHVALDKIGYSSLEIVIGECGWPTAGDVDATAANARTLLQNMITHCESGEGTPRLPNRAIRCFAFEMYDEDLKDTAPGPFETHWGVCDGAGNPEFALKW